MSIGERNLMGVVEYRGYTIKVLQQEDLLKLLIYAPDELIAQQMVVDRLSNHEEAMNVAKERIDRTINLKFRYRWSSAWADPTAARVDTHR